MKNYYLVKELTGWGFTDQQAKLYLAGLKLGQTLMMRLATNSKLKRSSCYYIMEELLRRGFFVSRKVGKRIYYTAATPERLLEMTKEREKRLLCLMPDLKKLSDETDLKRS